MMGHAILSNRVPKKHISGCLNPARVDSGSLQLEGILLRERSSGSILYGGQLYWEAIQR